MLHGFFVLRARTLFVDLDRMPHLVSRRGGGTDINRPLPGHLEVKRPVIHPLCVAGLSLDGSHVMRHRHRWHASVHHKLGILDGLPSLPVRQFDRAVVDQRLVSGFARELGVHAR